MKISIIISIYKSLDKLQLVLQGLEKQTEKEFEVIVSEDNDAEETIAFIENIQKQYKFPIKHVSQEDKGFRKTRILNKAILSAESEYLIFLDGDCIPHKKLVENYTKYLSPNHVCIGRRVYLDEYLTKKLIESNNLNLINLKNILLHGKHIDNAFYYPFAKIEHTSRPIIGCNWGIYKKNLIDINGFDEDYTRAGVGEDFDVDWRLRLNKPVLQFLNIKRLAITYHLYHTSNYSDIDTTYVNKQMTDKKQIGAAICINGIEKIKQ